jgi:hypothetical protein
MPVQVLAMVPELARMPVRALALVPELAVMSMQALGRASVMPNCCRVTAKEWAE